jgi:5-methyltetrahydropteroyltriglutamate--homocysteine methyltransferase
MPAPLAKGLGSGVGMDVPEGANMANIFSREDRVLTTHTGDLRRPAGQLEQVLAKADGSFDRRTYGALASAAVQACVRRQAESGIDIVGDGEKRSSFVLYAQDRLAGLEPRPSPCLRGFKRKDAFFLEDFERYLRKAIGRGVALAEIPLACAGPIEYVGQEQLQRDLDNLKFAAAQVDCSAAFMPSIAPSAVGSNEYYPSEDAFLCAAGQALRAEYKAIVEAGFLLQIDDPFLPDLFANPEVTSAQAQRRARAYVEILNHSIRDIPMQKIRYHISCPGAPGSRSRYVRFIEVARHMLRVNAAAYSFEAGTMRHEEDTELWEAIQFPDGKVIMPGLIHHASGAVEDLELIAERLVGFANRVGRDSVIASVNNQVGGGVTGESDTPAPVIWANLKALRDGARLASRKLWGARRSSQAA